MYIYIHICTCTYLYIQIYRRCDDMSVDDLKTSSQRALLLMDLTTLADDDTHERVEQLCKDAKTPFGCVAAVCIYAQFVGTAKKALAANGTPGVRVATVVNFPHGGDDVERAVQETREAVMQECVCGG